MILQNLVVPQKGICNESELYYHVSKGSVKHENGHLVLARGATVEFLTYFNSFSAGKWFEYTQIQEYEAVIQYTGACRLSLFRVRREDDHLIRKLVRETTGNHVESSEEKIAFCCDGKDWVYFISVTALEDTEVWHGSYRTGQPVTPRTVNIAIGICTYRREEYVTKTLETLETYISDDSGSDLCGHVHVFVSDNGNTLPLDGWNDSYIHVVYNKNAGGSGGFGRCMLEAERTRDKYYFTHILLMDDDIILEPESIFRTYALLSLRAEEFDEYLLGGALLRLDRPHIQHANGEMWNGGYIGFTKRGYDLRQEFDIVRNEERLPIEYSGWWYCCIPMTGDFSHSYPLPIFVHGDDIEYGLRFGGRIMTLNGIGVWHDAFDHRRASSMEYYDIRNALICNTIHYPEHTKARVIKKIYRRLLGNLLRYRYDDQLLTMKGVEDYCKGVDFLRGQDPVALHQQIMQMGYRMEDVSEQLKECQVERYYESPADQELYTDTPFVLRQKLTLNGWLLPGKKECIPIPLGAHAKKWYRCKRGFLFEPDTKKGFFVRRERKQLFITLARCIRMAWLIYRRYDKVVEDYRKHGEKLTTRAFWKKYLGQ